jgi:hypothetical protein
MGKNKSQARAWPYLAYLLPSPVPVGLQKGDSMNSYHQYDSYRQAVGIFKFLVWVNFVLLKLLLLWSHMAL